VCWWQLLLLLAQRRAGERGVMLLQLRHWQQAALGRTLPCLDGFED
jgi:hypothetical protein